MTDTSLPTISKARQQAHVADVRAFIKERKRADRLGLRIACTVAGVSLLTNFFQGIAQYVELPFHKIEPMIFVERSDGTLDYYKSQHDLPPSDRAKAIYAAVWAYTSLRESYTYRGSQEAWDKVSSMSSQAVKDNYHHFFLSDPSSPYNTIKNKGQVTVEPIGLPQLIRPTQLNLYGENVFQVRFKRIEQMDDALPVTTTWTATLDVTSAPALPAAAWLKDPAGIIVLRYSSQQDTPR